MDRGLEEVDDLLSTKGRSSGRAQGTLDREGTDPGRPEHSSSAADDPANSSSATAGNPTKTAGGAREQREGIGRVQARGSREHAPEISARGTGANAASILMSTTAPAGSTDAVSASAHQPTPHTPISMQQVLDVPPSEALINGGNDEAAHTDNEVPSGDAEATRRKGAVQSYYIEAGTTTGSGVRGLRCPSPPRRPAKKAVPFIQANGISLTYAQAKLFGLVGSPYPGASFKDRSFRAANNTNNFDTSRGRAGSKRPETLTGGSGTGLNGGTHDGRSRPNKQHPRARTYSPSRMDHLAQPTPGRGRVNDEMSAAKAAARGRSAGHHSAGEEASFTWKRSRKAEAAMR